MARKVFFSFLAVAVILTFPALAAERNGNLGTMTVSAAAVEWQASAPNVERLVLTVMTPSGAVITREFAGTRAIFSPKDAVPYNVGDGTYTYTLRGVPRIATAIRAQLNAARQRGDDAAIAQIQRDNGLTDPLSESGAFTVLNGALVTDAAEAPSAGASVAGKLQPSAQSAKLKPGTNDQVVADDEIVQGSLCVGLDCVVNESFGFDTIRLKENNTRIKFQDTSTGTGFPNVNWQLTANDSNSGGANKFSIDDVTNSKTPFTVTAAAPTNSIFVASSGKVGFGNNSPGLNLHITATDTPAIRQEQTNGGGFTAQTWDIGANEANWFVRDLTGGSRLPFRIRPGAPTSSVDIQASGNVGIGTASASTTLHVFSSSNPTIRVQKSAGTNVWDLLTDGSHFYIQDTNNSRAPIIAYNSGNVALASAGGNVGIGTTGPTSKLQVVGLPVYANNAAAVAGGLTAGAFYRTGADPDLVCVVH